MLSKFVAVLYCWNNELLTEDLPLLSGESLKVTATAFALLKRVSALSSGLPIWIDAVCINQEDCEEKETQVGMMRDIYSAAKCVSVWLGGGNLDEVQEKMLWSYLTSPQIIPSKSCRNMYMDRD